MSNLNSKIILCGGAGLVGQNLVHRLITKGYKNIVVIDKHKKNIRVLKKNYPNVYIIESDLATKGSWRDSFDGADVLIMLQAQIGGKNFKDFEKNNVIATENILENYKKYNLSRLVHVSSSVIKSVADDFYTQTKSLQESLIIDSGINCPILRPTLMFGWFDRKHFGWLSRFMKKTPIFPIPGDGGYIRQPLYVGDFCEIIISCIENPSINGIFNISGLEKVAYIEIIFNIKKAIKSRTLILKIPYSLFYILLKAWSLFDANPPFTVQQLEALVTQEEFEVINWPRIFNVKNTPYQTAINETFNTSPYSEIKLDF